MRTSTSAAVAAAPSAVFRVLADLSTWPRWLDVVTSAEPLAGARPTWRMRLGVRLGPLELGRDLRMEATVVEPDARLRFERREDDGRDDHSPVELEVELEPHGDETVVHLHAFVGKRLPFFDLEDELRRRGPAALARLEALVLAAG